MPNYQELYFKLFQSSVSALHMAQEGARLNRDAIALLIQIHQECEQLCMSDPHTQGEGILIPFPPTPTP